MASELALPNHEAVREFPLQKMSMLVLFEALTGDSKAKLGGTTK